MDDQQKQLVTKLKDSQNVLITVSKNPSVDQLAAAIGLTLALNKLDKHATAVYSGETPSTIEFLKPEDTLEPNTDSLRDFIIALDKSKADKLRYKVEDQVVRIFITPYKTSISEKDLEFSQGDFNIDAVVALGVKEQTDLDETIIAHGRILHDAIISVISVDGPSELGTMNIVSTTASSLSEVVAEIIEDLGKDILDDQIATALLTGIVATTDRFSNERTTPDTMKVSAILMAAGADQQLVATQLEATPESQDINPDTVPTTSSQEQDPGTLEITHSNEEVEASDDEDGVSAKADTKSTNTGETDSKLFAQASDNGTEGDHVTAPEAILPEIQNVHLQPQDNTNGSDFLFKQSDITPAVSRERVIEPPSWGGSLTANTVEEPLDTSTENLTLPTATMPILKHDEVVAATPPKPKEPIFPSFTPQQYQPQSAVASIAPVLPLTPEPSVVMPQAGQPLVVSQPSQITDSVMSPPPSIDTSDNLHNDVIDTDSETLSEIEKIVESPHAFSGQTAPNSADVPSSSPTDLDTARNAVEAALAAASADTPQKPIMALNAQPLGNDLHSPQAPASSPAPQYNPAPFTVTAPRQPEAFERVTDTLTPGTTMDMPLPQPIQGPSTTMPVDHPTFQDTSLPPPPEVPPPPIFKMPQ